MHAVHALAEDLDSPYRVFFGPQEVPCVDAAADPGTMVLDRLGDGVDHGELVAGTVVVNADRNAVFFDQLVQQVEALGIGIDSQVAETHGTGEFEDFAIGRLIVAEFDHALADHLDARGFSCFLISWIFARSAVGDVSGERFPIVQAQVLGHGQGPFGSALPPW